MDKADSKRPDGSHSTRDADVIVIGAGMGGLCAAARLVAVGCRVIVLEKSPYLGGRCSHRVRDGFTVTTGAIMIPIGPDSAIRQAFDLVSAPMDTVDVTGRMRYRLAHGDYDLPVSGGGLKGMIEFALQGDEAAAERLIGQFIAALGETKPNGAETFLQWLKERTDSEAVKGLFHGFCAALMGTSLHEIPADEFFRFLGSSSRGSRYGMAAHGNGRLMEALAAGVEQHGGAIARGARCERILVESGRAIGVELRDEHGGNRLLRANYVVSNLGPRRTMALAGEEQLFDGPYRARLEAAPHVAPIIHYSFVLDEPLIPQFGGSLVFGNTRNLIFLEIPSNISPELAPAGRHLHTAYGALADARVADLRPEAENTLRELEENFPGVLRKARFLVRARHSGASPGMHRWPGFMMPVDTPVANLYNVGDGVTPPGTIGTEGASASAREAVARILGHRSASP